MSEQLIRHIQKFVVIKEEDIPGILALFKHVNISKKENIQEAGKICRSHYFVEKGCLRMFFVNDKGIEQTTQFAIENWWISDYAAFQNQQTAGFCIQAVEKTDAVSITLELQEQLLHQYPQLERYFRIIHQRANAAAQQRIKYLYDFSREELYHHFNNKYPEFTQRIPQYLLASFLGITPEYLSEIRKKPLLKRV